MRLPNRNSRIGLFGGSFDPIHSGHLSIAAKAVEQFNLDRVVFIPAAQSPLKANSPTASDKERVEMIRLAIGPFPSFKLSDMEVERGGLSYSAETTKKIAQQFPDAKLFWIIGGDQAIQLDRWRKIEELAQEVEFIYLERDEPTEIPPIVSQLTKAHPLKMDRIPISSTAIRQQVNSGDDPKYFLPESVFHYIKTRNLYRDDQTTL